MNGCGNLSSFFFLLVRYSNKFFARSETVQVSPEHQSIFIKGTMKTPWSILERERNTGRGKYSSDAWLGREQPDMLQYHADFVSSVTMLLCNYISPILASYFVTRVLRNEREKKKISLLSTLLLPCRDNVNVFILFSHSETQTRASLSLSLLLQNCIHELLLPKQFTRNSLATISKTCISIY